MTKANMTTTAPKELIEIRDAVAKALGIVDLCFQNEGPDKEDRLVKRAHLYPLMEVAEEAVHYAHDLLTAMEWEPEMVRHMEGRESDVEELSLELHEARAFLNLLALSGNKHKELDTCGLFGLARN